MYNQRLQQQQQQAPVIPPLLSFKAGRCVLSPSTDGKFTVSADLRRGTITLKKDAHDNLLRFIWTDRTLNVIEENKIIFPDQFVWKKVKTGRDADRVFILKFTNGNDRLMFWMQDKVNKDDELSIKINEYFNNPEAVTTAMNTIIAAAAASNASSTYGSGILGGSNASMGGGGNLNNILGIDFTSILNNLNLPAANNGVIPPATPALTVPAATTNATTPTPVTVEDLQRTMIGSSPSANSSSAFNNERSQPVRLEDIVTADAVLNSDILNDPVVRQNLLQHLPDSQRSDEFLEETIRSPQFRQALGALSSALQSENYNSVMANFSINPDPGMMNLMSGDAVRAFLSSIQHEANATIPPQPPTQEEEEKEAKMEDE